jgi:hypothetical protein
MNICSLVHPGPGCRGWWRLALLIRQGRLEEELDRSGFQEKIHWRNNYRLALVFQLSVHSGLTKTYVCTSKKVAVPSGKIKQHWTLLMILGAANYVASIYRSRPRANSDKLILNFN